MRRFALLVVVFAAGVAAGAGAVYLSDGTNEDEPEIATLHGFREPQTFTLEDGDVAMRPAARTRCVALGEGTRPNLVCSRMRDRYDVTFFEDIVRLRARDGRSFSYTWRP